MITPRPGRVVQTNRGTVQVGQQQVSAPITFPAPTGGLMTNADAASNRPGMASVLENWFPTFTGARIRGGSEQHGIASDGTDIVSMFRYKYGADDKLFVATETAIYNMTSPSVPPATTAATVTGLTSGDWCSFQHTNSGVSYLVLVNGADGRYLYDGSSFVTTPAITFSDSTVVEELNYGWLFANREFFIKNNSLDAYYLDVAAFGGAATVFPLGGVMKKGGSLLCGFSWSVESGEGSNEYCCFVSTEGEVAIYIGTDPSSADTFTLKGVYQISKPLGKNAFVKISGDVLLCTADGLIPMSQVMVRGRESVSLSSASRPVDDLWAIAIRNGLTGWAAFHWQEQGLIFITFPSGAYLGQICLVMNSVTGKWCIVRNWVSTCFGSMSGNLYFGGASGVVWQGDVTGEDDGAPFAAVYLSHFLPTKFGQRCSASLASMEFKSTDQPSVKLFARADFDTTDLPTAASVSENGAATSLWDVALWDVDVWDGGTDKNRYRFRQNVNATGNYLALGCAILSSGDRKLDLDLEIGLLQTAAGEEVA